MPIISHTGAHSSVASTARQERISLGLTTVRRKLTISANQIGSRISRAAGGGSRVSQGLAPTPTGSQCPSPRMSTVTAPGITPPSGQPAGPTIQEMGSSLDSTQTQSQRPASAFAHRKFSTVVGPPLCGSTDGVDSQKLSVSSAGPSTLQLPTDGSSLQLTHYRSVSTARAPIAIHIEGPTEATTPNEVGRSFALELEHQLLGVDAMPLKKHSTSARVTNLRAQAEQLRRMRSLSEKRPDWLLRLFEGILVSILVLHLLYVYEM